MRFFALLAVTSTLGLAAVPALAQIEAPAYSGSFEVDGSPYPGGPILWFSLARLSAGGIAPNESSVTLVPQPNLPSNTRGRTVLKFTADGAGDLGLAKWMLPESEQGTTSIASAGESRLFQTWTPEWCIAPANNHSFRASVAVLGAGVEAWIDLDVQEAPRPFLENMTGPFTHTTLDNGTADQNLDAGQVLLDKNLTPGLSFDFGLPKFDMHRTNIFWQDFTETSSPFWDHTYSAMVVTFDGPNGFHMFTGPNSDLVLFAPGEGDSLKSIEAHSGSMSVDLSLVRNGTYTVRYWAVPLVGDFSDGSGHLGCANGFVPIEHVEMNVTVVPEPATFAVFGLGLIALRRRKR